MFSFLFVSFVCLALIGVCNSFWYIVFATFCRCDFLLCALCLPRRCSFYYFGLFIFCLLFFVYFLFVFCLFFILYALVCCLIFFVCFVLFCFDLFCHPVSRVGGDMPRAVTPSAFHNFSTLVPLYYSSILCSCSIIFKKFF